jgi:hypothetical protein
MKKEIITFRDSDDTNNLLFAVVFVLIILTALLGCTKFVEVETPSTKTSTESAYKNDLTANAVILGIYAQLSNKFNDVGLTSTSVLTELSADNLELFDVNGSEHLKSYYQNSLEPRYEASGDQTYWRQTYSLLYTINNAIEELTDNSFLTPKVSERLLGEALFLRAFCYFYLVNLYGDVPLVLSTKYNVNSSIPRTPSSEVYNQILLDLSKAEPQLDYNYVGADGVVSSNERIRPNLAAVMSLKARVYLYQQKFSEAEMAATEVINKSAYQLVNLNDVFLMNSKETIWALQPVRNGFNTGEGGLFLLPDGGPDGTEYPVYASYSLVNSFEEGDSRLTTWLGNISANNTIYYYPAKYKVPKVPAELTDITEYTIVFRLAEQFLIRAEARNELNNPQGALEDLNNIRSRARAESTTDTPNPLPNLPSTLSKAEIKQAIFKERRVELFTEWGNRWFDLKRSGNIDEVMLNAEGFKGGTWLSYKSLYPIPQSDILLNSLLTQNPGYTN